MSHNPYPGSGYPGYPPQQQGYPPQSGYPPQQQGGYPGQQSGYPGQQGASGYPPQTGGYPPQSGYPPTNPQSGYPPSSTPQPQQQQQGYPPQGQSPYGAPPQAPQAWYGQYYNQINPQEMQVLQAWFASVDRDRSGEISAVELAQLNFNNRLLGQEPAKKLIAIFDKDRSGQISFTEYASLHQFLNTLLGQFQTAERKPGSQMGNISVNEVHPALQTAGFTLSTTAVINICKKYDAQKRGLLTWEEFLGLASHVALLKSIFEWSDTDRDGKVTFDFEAFAFATLYL